MSNIAPLARGKPQYPIARRWFAANSVAWNDVVVMMIPLWPARMQS